MRLNGLLPGNNVVEHLDHLLRECMSETQSVTVQLCPPVPYDSGLVAGFAWLVQRMREKHQLRVDLHADEDVQPRDEGLRVVLFEAVRELLFNVVHHSGVDLAQVDLRKGPHGTIVVQVSDAGAGFDLSHVRTVANLDGGFGMLAVRERVALFSGTVEIDTEAGKGTRVRLTFPAEKPL